MLTDGVSAHHNLRRKDGGGSRIAMTHVLSDKERKMLPSRARTLEHLQRLVGNIHPYIVPSKQSGRCRVLEIGCGFGQVLIDLHVAYGNVVELHGINRYRSGGNADLALRVADHRNLIDTSRLPIASDLRIQYADAGSGLPYDDGFFDLIISQMAIVFVADKARLLAEISRVLAPSGTALLHTQFNRPELPEPFNETFTIHDGGDAVPLDEFFASYSSFFYMQTDAGSVLKIHGGANLNLPVSLVESIDLSTLGDAHGQWYGTQSKYVLNTSACSS